MAKNLISRYLWLVDLIYRRSRITLREINNRWIDSSLSDGCPIPIRTFHNHRQAIQEMFDMNIVCDKHANEYYIEDSDSLDKSGIRNWLLHAFSVNNMLKESEKLNSRILLGNAPSGQHYLALILEAMRDGRLVELEYQRYNADIPHKIEVEPWFLKIFRQRWYLLGKNQNKEIRIYALDRIKQLKFSINMFILPEEADGDLFFQDYFGIIRNQQLKVETIKLKVSVLQSRYLCDLPLHNSQKETVTTQYYSVFTYRLKPTFDFVQEVLSMGESVEVLAPESLRRQIKQRLTQALQAYCE